MLVRKIAITPPEALVEIECAGAIEHQSRSEVVAEALSTHLDETVYTPSDDERRSLVAALDELERASESVEEWDAVRSELRAMRSNT
ncbi:MAG: hypothetical protein DI566_12140 [Microbacterium sp.]|nr:MAG: hypothetical protein DI566_12140 [Microbacterium sp.]